jgi:hypothetical protein
MSQAGDSNEEMIMTFPDTQVEVLLAGGIPDDPALTPLIEFVSELRGSGLNRTANDGVDVIAIAALTARKGVREAVSPVDHASPTQTKRRRRPVLRPAWVAAMMVVGFASVAVAADGASPGDPLYGLDRALEQFGIGAGGLDERLTEVAHLVAKGHPEEALSHLARSIDAANLGEVERNNSRIDHNLNKAAAAGGPDRDRLREQVDAIRALLEARDIQGRGPQQIRPDPNSGPSNQGQGDHNSSPGRNNGDDRPGNQGHGNDGPPPGENRSRGGLSNQGQGSQGN